MKFHQQTLRCAHTGREFRQLTSDDCSTHHAYFTHPCFLPESDQLVLRSDVGGSYQLILLDISTGGFKPLTPAGDRPTGYLYAVDIVRRQAYYTVRDDKEIMRVDFDTGGIESICEAPAGMFFFDLFVSGKTLVFGYTEDLLHRTISGGQGHRPGHEFWWSRPRTIFMRMDVETGVLQAFYGDTQWLGHLQISPVDEELALFCHQSPGNLPDNRMWVVGIPDAVKKKARTPYREKEWEVASHEWFTASGRIGFQLINFKEKRYFNGFVDPEGTGLELFEFPGPHEGSHLYAVDDKSFGVSDILVDPENQKEGMNYLVRLDYDRQNHRAVQTPLLRHGNLKGQRDQSTDCHPVITPDQKAIFFTSAMKTKGRPAVFWMSLEEE